MRPPAADEDVSPGCLAYFCDIRRFARLQLDRACTSAGAGYWFPRLASWLRAPHASEEARKIAEEGTILRVQVGSGVHGTSVSGQDDRDEMGLCLEPPQFVTGLARVPDGIRGLGPSVWFEQYERHTAWDRPGGVAKPFRGWRPGCHHLLRPEVGAAGPGREPDRAAVAVRA
jgi:hypothetical protein